jgi:hypothetical protein
VRHRSFWSKEEAKPMSSNSKTERALESEIAELPTVAEVIAAMGAQRLASALNVAEQYYLEMAQNCGCADELARMWVADLMSHLWEQIEQIQQMRKRGSIVADAPEQEEYSLTDKMITRALRDIAAIINSRRPRAGYNTVVKSLASLVDQSMRCRSRFGSMAKLTAIRLASSPVISGCSTSSLDMDCLALGAIMDRSRPNLIDNQHQHERRDDQRQQDSEDHQQESALASSLQSAPARPRNSAPETAEPPGGTSRSSTLGLSEAPLLRELPFLRSYTLPGLPNETYLYFEGRPAVVERRSADAAWSSR